MRISEDRDSNFVEFRTAVSLMSGHLTTVVRRRLVALRFTNPAVFGTMLVKAALEDVARIVLLSVSGGATWPEASSW